MRLKDTWRDAQLEFQFAKHVSEQDRAEQVNEADQKRDIYAPRLVCFRQLQLPSL